MRKHGLLAIGRAGESLQMAIVEVVSVLSKLRANIVGVVLNQVGQDTFADSYSYYGYYRYGHYQKSE
jgi:Mrp family chromosome partitioning ATPase